jgi:hypothetical protein
MKSRPSEKPRRDMYCTEKNLHTNHICTYREMRKIGSVSHAHAHPSCIPMHVDRPTASHVALPPTPQTYSLKPC